MAKGKKSFVLYSDQKELFEALTDEQSGKLIKHIFQYVNDENPTLDDPILKIAFITIKSILKRDLNKWEKQIKQRSEAGKKSAESRKRNATAVNENQRTLTDNVNVNVNVNDNVNENNQIDVDKINFVDLLNFFNKTFNKKCRVFSNEAKRKYKARLKEGYTKDDIANAMRSCSLSKWHKESNYKDCTLEFFSRANILDKYAFNSQTKNNYIATK
jgi:uncharacterized phage protein (TIGR02220 family)